MELIKFKSFLQFSTGIRLQIIVMSSSFTATDYVPNSYKNIRRQLA